MAAGGQFPAQTQPDRLQPVSRRSISATGQSSPSRVSTLPSNQARWKIGKSVASSGFLPFERLRFPRLDPARAIPPVTARLPVLQPTSQARARPRQVPAYSMRLFPCTDGFGRYVLERMHGRYPPCPFQQGGFSALSDKRTLARRSRPAERSSTSFTRVSQRHQPRQRESGWLCLQLLGHVHVLCQSASRD